MPRFPRTGEVWAAAMAAGLLAGLTGAAAQDESELGRHVFTTEAVPHCTICHALADAEATGEIGPNLDEVKPTVEEVRLAVTEGFEAMPSYSGKLTQDEIDAVSRYVAGVAGKDS